MLVCLCHWYSCAQYYVCTEIPIIIKMLQKLAKLNKAKSKTKIAAKVSNHKFEWTKEQEQLNKTASVSVAVFDHYATSELC